MHSRKAATRILGSTVSAIALTMLMSAPALATTVTFSDIVASWHDVAPPGVFGLTFQGNPSPNPKVFWGQALTAAGQSGYSFAAAANPFDVQVNPPPQSSDFDIGTFTHINRPISLAVANPSITGVQLSVSATIVVDGVNQGTRTFDFQFLHDETPNDANPCAFGGANGQGININGCADRVRVTGLNTSDTFNVGGIDYTVNILGFRAGGQFVDQFLTRENAENPAALVANISVAQVAVPEPASLLLLGTGLLGLGVAMRRRNHDFKKS